MNYFTNPEVIFGTEGLVRSEGFWSKKEILICNADKPTVHLLNKKTTTNDLIQAIESHIDLNLRDVIIKEYLRAMEKIEAGVDTSSVGTRFRFHHIPDLNRPEFIGERNVRQLPRWTSILMTLRREGKNYDEIAAFLADSWLEYYRENTPAGMDCSTRLEGQMPLFLIAWRNFNTTTEPAEFIKALWHLMELNVSSEKILGKGRPYTALVTKDGFDKFLKTISDVEWQLLKKFNATEFKEFNRSNAIALTALPKAAALAWAILIKNKFALVNPGAFSLRLPEAFNALGELDQYGLKKGDQWGRLLPILSSTTVNIIKDIPANLPDLLPQPKGRSYTGILKTILINYPTEEHGFPLFDLSRFSRTRTKKTEKELVGTPEWFRDNGYSQDWCEFCGISLEGKGGVDTTKRTLKHIAEWTGQRFNSPWDIKPVDLRTPANPKNTDTFFAYLNKRRLQSKADIWARTALLFKRVANYLNTPGYPGYEEGVKRNNPFETIENPFKKSYRNGNKTHRSRISTVLHDRLIEVLLSPDENGKPIFKWARESSRKHFSASDFLPDGSWCPSRWTALALLLLLPPRKKQVRWLDQGLMDEFIFDPDTFSMVENTHKLFDFRYEDGQSHQERYGRPSGAIQQITDSFMGKTEHLGLFINTNKTQLWNPKRRNGYELPWPDGKELLESEDPEVQEQGRWLRKVYDVLAYQYKCVQQNDPDPVPVTFSDVYQDRMYLPKDPEIQKSLPYFVPLFREFSNKETVNRDGELIHASLPITAAKIVAAFTALCMEVELLLKSEGFEHVQLTVPNKTKSGKSAKKGSISSRSLKFDIHSLRVAGISRLIEMDIDPTIVQEFVAGHLTPAMTHRYLKFQPWHVREKIIEALINGNLKSAMDIWAENIAKGKDAHGFVSAPRFREYVANFPDDYASIAPVSGGICIMGGMGDACNEGGVYEQDVFNKDETETVFGPVQGGCGNCRFFKTAPFLIMEQSFYLDSLMDDLRAMAALRKELRTKITDLECRITGCVEPETKHSLDDQKSIHKARLESVNHDMVPMLTEWVNRYMMLQDCQKIIDENVDAQSDLALVSTFGTSVGLTVEDLKVEIEKTTELGLAGRIVEKARTLEGRGIAIPAKPALMLQRSVDVILRSTGSPYLLLDITDGQIGRAASMLYNALEESFGAEAIEQAAKKQAPLPLDCSQREKINTLASAVVSATNKGKLTIESVAQETNGNTLIEGAP
ncbi:MAG: VPA1269 family protein [Desulfuromonadales bacterium]